nr:retrovirus-related Pol polyprotein from transposon TNT 1-94 [Tanacetum cinerariifolium]
MLKTVSKTPQQNGVAERMNRTLNERAKSTRLHTGLPKMFWEDSVTLVAYLINRVPSVPLGFRILEEEWKGKEASLAHLRVFGYDSYVKVKDVARDNLDAKSMKCTFIGYGSDEMGYCFWDSKSHKVVQSRDVTFNEDSLYGAKKKAINEETISLEKNHTWSLVKLPARNNTLQSKWVFRVKEEHDGKKRLVLSFIAAENLHLKQLDVKTSFLHGNFYEDIYMTQPEGFHSAGKEENLMQVEKSSNMAEIKKLKRQLSQEFKMKDLGLAKQILGMSIIIDRMKGKSTTGYVFTVGGTIVSWMSRIQKCVAMSTTEAEYMAIAEAGKELVRSRADPAILNDFEMAAEGNGDPPVLDLQTMVELCQPSLIGQGGPITLTDIQATNIRLKNDMIQQDTSAPRSESYSSITSSSDLEIVALKAKMPEINKSLMRVLQANDAILKNMQTSMTSLTNSNLELKNMFGQFMKMNTASSSGSGTLPSIIITNPKKDLKGVTNQSGNAYQGPTIPTTFSSLPQVVERETEVTDRSVHPLIDHHCRYECGNSLNDLFCYQCTCKFCGNGAHVGYNCPAQVPSVQTLPSFPQQSLCYEDSEVTHEPYKCQPMNEVYYYGKNSCYDSNSFSFDQSQPQQYTVNHPIFNAHNDYLDSQIQLNSTLAKITKQMTSITSLCEMAYKFVHKKLEEKQLEEERAAKAQNWKLPFCYDDDDVEERSDSLDDNIISGLPSFSAITPNEPVVSTEEPDNSLSMGDEHLDTIPATELDEDLIPIPSESEGIPFSSIDDDSFSIDNIDYVEASPPDSELVSSEVMEIVITEVGGIDADILLKDEILRENLLNVNHLFAKLETSNDNPIPFYDPIISGNPLTLTPSGEKSMLTFISLQSCGSENHVSSTTTSEVLGLALYIVVAREEVTTTLLMLQTDGNKKEQKTNLLEKCSGRISLGIQLCPSS